MSFSVDTRRRILGCLDNEPSDQQNEDQASPMSSAVRQHYMALKRVKSLYSDGHATKDDTTKALQLYQAYLDEIKSDQRDKAAAFSDVYRYY